MLHPNDLATIEAALEAERARYTRMVDLYTSLEETKQITQGEIAISEKAQSKLACINATLARVQSLAQRAQGGWMPIVEDYWGYINVERKGTVISVIKDYEFETDKGYVIVPLPKGVSLCKWVAAQDATPAQGDDNEPLPCPFCGGEAEVTIESSYYQVMCKDEEGCTALGLFGHVDRAAAIREWNRRAQPVPPQGELPAPDWATAPTWAMWWVHDTSGFTWHEFEPYLHWGGEWRKNETQSSGRRKRPRTKWVHSPLALGIDYRTLKQPRPAQRQEGDDA